MSHSMTRSIKKIEAPVAVKVEGIVLAELKTIAFGGDVYFSERTAFPRSLIDR